MKTLLLVIYGLVVIALAVGTWVEYIGGTAFSLQFVYHSFWFVGLWGSLLVGLVYALTTKRLPLFSAKGVLHLSFVVIFLGALITHCFGVQGMVHLTPQSKVDSFTDMDTRQVHTLPFTMQLDSFHIDYYPGGVVSKDYLSYVKVDTIACVVSMNQVLSVCGYRFCQSSYDENGRGTWLRVNHDPWGMGITYLGYVLFAIGSVVLLSSPRSGFRQLLQKAKRQLGGKVPSLLFIMLLGCTVEGNATPLKALCRRQADSLALQPVIYQGRVVPLNTLAVNFVKKLTGKSRYKGLTPEQVLGGWLLAPRQWKAEPMIRIKSEVLRRRMGLAGECVSFMQLFHADGSYKLCPLWKELQQDSSAADLQNDNLGKAILEVDEKVGIILMLLEGKLVQPLPTDERAVTPFLLRMRVEVLYNRLPFNKVLFMFNLSVGLLALVNWIRQEVKEQPGGTLLRVWKIALYLSLCVQLLSYALRTYLCGHLPLSNGYETMQFLALVVLLTAGLLQRRFAVLLPFGFLLSGFTLLVAYLGQMNPQITPLMPVLLSPWMSLHVSLIMMAYALFGFTFLIAILVLSLQRRLPNAAIFRITTLSRILLYPAILFLGIGIFIGAIWANESWGRYWAWDSKEVWALISFMAYGLAVHSSSLPWLRRPVAYHSYLIAAFTTILMTYFGVNYLLGGMHSYAG